MRRCVPTIAVVLVTALALAGAGCQKEPATPAFELPADLLALLPAAPSAIVLVASLDAVDASRAELEAGSGDEPVLPPEALAALDARAALERHLPGLAALVAEDRPLALAIQAPAPMVGQKSLTLLVPLRDPDAALPAVPAGHAAPVRRGAYVALPSNPAYAPADTVPALAHGLRGGLVMGAIDLAGIIELYRPLIDMGLGAMAMEQAQDPDAAMSAEAAQSLATMARSVMDALERLDLTMDLAAGELSLSGQLAVVPGSVFEPGPQPDFATALELSGYLPPGAHMLEVLALDQSRQMDLFRDFYLLSLEQQLAALPPETAVKYKAWFEDYLDISSMFACPAAASVNFGAAGVEMLMVAQPDAPAAMVQAMAEQLAALSDVGLGVVFTPAASTELGSHTVHRWQIDLDPEALAAWENDAPDSPGALQAAQMTLVLRDLLPSLALVEVGPHVLFGATADDAAFTGLYERIERGGADPEPRALQAAAAAGPDCRQVVLGDLTPLFNWLMRTAADLGAEADFPILDTPVPYRTTLTTAAEGYGVTVATDVPAIRAAVAAMKALEDMEQHGHQSH